MRYLKNRWAITAMNLLALLAIIYYFFNNSGDFEHLGDIGILVLFATLVIQMGSLFVTGLFIRLSVLPLGINVPLKDGFSAAILSALGNFFMPAGSGTSLRAVYLKKLHNLDYSSFMSTLYGNYIIVFFVNALAGGVALVFLGGYSKHFRYWVIASVLLGFFVGSLFFMSKKINRYIVMVSKLKFMPQKISKYTVVMIEGWRTIVASKELGPTILLAAVNTLLQVMVLYLVSLSVAPDVNLSGVVLLSSLSAFSIIINITPGSIGIRETIFAFSAFAMNASVTEVVLISLIERLTRFIAMLFGWLITYRYRTKQISQI